MKFKVEPNKGATSFEVIIKADDTPTAPGEEIGRVEGFESIPAAHSFIRDFLSDLFTKRWRDSDKNKPKT